MVKVGDYLEPPFKIKALLDEDGEVTEDRSKLDKYEIEDANGVRAQINAKELERMTVKVPKQ